MGHKRGLPSCGVCDETLLDRYLNSDLSREKEDALLEHLETCSRCRQYLNTLIGFAKDLGNRVENAVNQVDFTTLEKEVLTTVIHHPLSPGKGPRATAMTKLFLTILLVTGALALIVYLYTDGFFGH